LEIDVTFDQWIDAVNAQVRTRLGPAVQTRELSWDSAWWVSRAGNAVAALADDEQTAKITFDGGGNLALAFRLPEGDPVTVGAQIAERLTSR
jgi:hypothetical protein